MVKRWVGIACLSLLLTTCGERTSALPPRQVKPLPVQHVETAPGAGVAWFASMMGVTPDGHVLSMAFGSSLFNGSSGSWGLRSADGGHLFVLSSGRLLVASATDGHTVATIDLPDWPPNGLSAALSRNGRWLALAQPGRTVRLALIDLARGQVEAAGWIASATPSGGAISGIALLVGSDG